MQRLHRTNRMAVTILYIIGAVIGTIGLLYAEMASAMELQPVVQPVVSVMDCPECEDTGDTEATAYGVRWDQTTDTYTTGTITDGAFVGGAVTAWPIQEQMRRCVLSDAGEVQYYLCDTDSTLKADCTTAAVLDGTDGQVMVEVPQFYFIQAHYGSYRYFFLANGPFRLTLPDSSEVDAAIHPAFYKGGSATASDYRYVGAYEGAMWDDSASAIAATVHTDIYAAGDQLLSVSGEYPKTNEKITEFRDMAEARGAGWHQYDHAIHAMLSILYLTEYADFNSQSQIGNGRTGLSDGAWEAGSYIGITGLSNGDGNATANVSNGGTNYGTDYMSYRGVENWFGNVWKWADGINVYNAAALGSQLYLCTDHTAYTSDTSTGYTLAGNLPTADGYPTDIIDTIGVYPVSVGGTSATYLANYYYTYYDTDANSGWRVARVGGSAVSGADAGAFCWNSNFDSTIAHAAIGGRLCF